MGFWSLLEVASMPILQILLIGLLGAFLATNYINVLSPTAIRDLNKMVYVVFSPALVFASLAETVSLEDFLSWWFMPVNVAITFLIGGVLGWVVTKLIKPEHHLEGVIICNCAAGNLGNLPLIVIPAICNEAGNPFGANSTCSTRGLSYVSLSMAIGNIFIWTIAYGLMKDAGRMYDKTQSEDRLIETPNSNGDLTEITCQTVIPLLSNKHSGRTMGLVKKLKEIIHQIGEELMTPPIIAAIAGFAVGAMPWFKLVVFGETAPLKVLQDSLVSLGAATVPCVILVLGGNLTLGLRKTVLKPLVTLSIIAVRYVMLPVAGIFVVKAAGKLGFLPQDPLYSYVLLLQFSLPPAMSIGTLAQLFNIGQEECSVIFLWTYSAAALAITFWSTIFLWIVA